MTEFISSLLSKVSFWKVIICTNIAAFGGICGYIRITVCCELLKTLLTCWRALFVHEGQFSLAEGLQTK